MKFAATSLIVASALSLLACGPSDDVQPPAMQPPAADTAQAGPAPEPVVPVAAPPQPESPPATQPTIQQAPPAAASKPAASSPTEASPPRPAGESAPSAPASDPGRGEQIYRQACAFCHDKGVAGAPKTGDVAAWSPRLAQGMDVLYTSALHGKRAMPAKGGNPSLADADVKAAVDYLTAQAR